MRILFLHCPWHLERKGLLPVFFPFFPLLFTNPGPSSQERKKAAWVVHLKACLFQNIGRDLTSMNSQKTNSQKTPEAAELAIQCPGMINSSTAKEFPWEFRPIVPY
jgi:hypothetical protein